ncbi:MAG: Ppx/GppA family phosphatase [Thermoleophilaceae bacterium]|nr:Ppx/GppA family phosphatase [Thermoleophilaceae bacterium]
MRIAVIDLGTNSTRLLVADVEDARLTILERRTSVTRLGEGVDRSGRLAEPAMARVYEAVAEFRRAIDELGGADRVIGVATSAVREAANGGELRAALHERYGVDTRIITGDEEAQLTFLGATAGRPDDGEPTLVIDIGGGSTELVVGRPGEDPTFHVSTQAGSVRQTERHIHSDPPTEAELAAVAAEARGIIERGAPADVRAAVRRGIAVAGTPTSLAAIELELDPYDSERVHGHELALAAAERIQDRLASLPLEQRRRVTGLHPDRAPTIIAGVAILIEAMRAFGLESVEVSESDILQGAALREALASG